jgi:hypothetical protein
MPAGSCFKCHYSTGGTEAVQGKQKFEHLAASYGVKIKAYRADNGIMAKKEFLQNAENCQQSITLSGVNNHSQNGIAERNIRTMCDRTRTMLLHAMQRWPEAVTIDLWPFALKLAVDIHNATPGPSGLSPEEIFSRQKSRQDRLHDYHTFGCPLFVLEPRLQQGQRIPKWHPRSRQAIYLGHSPRHAQTVPVVLNRCTGLCSPQYHVVFDDHFTTVPHTDNPNPPNNWPDLFEHNTLNVLADEPELADTLPLAPEWTTTDPITSEGDTNIPEGASIIPKGASSTDSPMPEGGYNQVEPAPQRPLPDASTTDQRVTSNEETKPRHGWNQHHSHATRFKARLQANQACIHNIDHKPDATVMIDRFQAMTANIETISNLEGGTTSFTHPVSSMSDNKDTLNYGEMLSDIDRPKFVEAMQTEVAGLQKILKVIKRNKIPV